MKKFCSVILIVLLTSLMASAAVVNVDLNGTSSKTQGNYSGQGALVDPGNDFWNDGAPQTLSDLIASDGITVTTMDIAIDGGSDWGYPSDNILLGDYEYVTTNAWAPTTRTIEIAGLIPNAAYAIYLYGAGDTEGQATQFTLNGLVAATTGTVSADFIEGGNYVVMQVNADANGQILGEFTVNTEIAGNKFGGFNGFQVQGEIPTVPEPATLSLLALGALALRKRSA